MRNFIRELPDSLLDAARVDGAGELRVFWFVVLPLVRPAMAAVSVLVFTFVWNDYFWSLVLVQSDCDPPGDRRRCSRCAGCGRRRGTWWRRRRCSPRCRRSRCSSSMQRHLIAGLTYSAAVER